MKKLSETLRISLSNLMPLSNNEKIEILQYIDEQNNEIERLNKIIEIKNNRIQQLMKRTRSARINKAIECIQEQIIKFNEQGFFEYPRIYDELLSILRGGIDGND